MRLHPSVIIFLSRAVQDIVENDLADEEFTWEDIATRIRSNDRYSRFHPSSNEAVQRVLKGMIRNKRPILEVATPGAGRRRTIYRRVVR